MLIVFRFLAVKSQPNLSRSSVATLLLASALVKASAVTVTSKIVAVAENLEGFDERHLTSRNIKRSPRFWQLEMCNIFVSKLYSAITNTYMSWSRQQGC